MIQNTEAASEDENVSEGVDAELQKEQGILSNPSLIFKLIILMVIYDSVESLNIFV